MAREIRFTIKVVIAMLWVSIIHVHDSVAATPARLRSVTQLRVFDSTGKLVGPVLRLDAVESAIVGFKVGNYIFPLTVQRAGFIGNTNEVAMFTTSNCAGNAYSDPHTVNLPFPPFIPTILAGQKKIYIQDGPVQSVNLFSNLDLITPGATCNSFPQAELRNVVPVVLLIDNLDTQFIAPFTIE